MSFLSFLLFIYFFSLAWINPWTIYLSKGYWGLPRSKYYSRIFCCCSFAKSCLILCEPMECSSPDPSIFHNLESRFKFMSIELIMLSNHFILCCPLSSSGQFSSVTQLCPTLCNPMDCSMPGFPVHHQLLDPTQTHVHWVGDAIQPSHPLSCPSPPAFNLSQHQGFFKWVTSLHQVAKVLEFQL